MADRGTIAAAADALHVTPSAVSQQLAALEREVGHPLMEPDGRTVRLTPVARVLVRRADAIFAEIEQLHSEVADLAGGEVGDVRVGAFATAIASLVAPAAEELRRDAPGLTLGVAEAEAPEAFDLLGAHGLDLVISMEAPGAPGHADPRFARVDLMRDRLDVALPAGHRLAGAGEVELAALSEETWVAPPVGWSCERVTVAACQAAGFSPAVAHRSADWPAVVALVSAGLGVALVPRLARPAPAQGVVLRPPAGEAPCRHLFVACRRGAESAPSMRLVIDALARRAKAEAERPVML